MECGDYEKFASLVGCADESEQGGHPESVRNALGKEHGKEKRRRI
jgi:hypothetical protein